MKIKLTALTCILLASMASVEARPDTPSQQFKEAKVLERPYQGTMLPGLNANGPNDRRQEQILLNYYLPPGTAKGKPSNTVPYLATTEDGSEYWNAHAYRSSLPTGEEIAALKTYADFVRLLGEPIDPPSGAKTEGEWSYDTVVWRLFMPAEGANVTVMHVTLRRKWAAGTGNGADEPDYQIDGLSIREGAFQPGIASPAFIVPRLLDSTSVVSPP
jgi:hypothetical protein